MNSKIGKHAVNFILYGLLIIGIVLNGFNNLFRLMKIHFVSFHFIEQIFDISTDVELLDIYYKSQV